MYAGPGSYLLGKEEKKEVQEVLESGHLFRYGDLESADFTHKVYTLEKEYAEYVGSKYCVATTGGTSALFIGLLTLGIKPGDEVIVPGYTYVATYSAIIFAGGIPVFTEVDESLNIDPLDIEKRITPKTKFIVPVHMLGNPADMDPILRIAKKYKLNVLEDSCQAVGGSYNGKMLGSIGDIGAYSLNFFKTITSGDGGLLVTNEKHLYERAFGLHDQGHAPNRGWQIAGKRTVIGLNFRMTELTGAVALAQFRKLPQVVETLRAKKKLLKDLIGNIPNARWRTLNDPNGECAVVLTVIFDDKKQAEYVAEKLGCKTLSNTGWHVYYNMEHIIYHLRQMGRIVEKGMLPKTDDIVSRTINFSIGILDAYGLGSGFGININSSNEEIHSVAEKIKKVVL